MKYYYYYSPKIRIYLTKPAKFAYTGIFTQELIYLNKPTVSRSLFENNNKYFFRNINIFIKY
jgi:hypothetical protein